MNTSTYVPGDWALVRADGFTAMLEPTTPVGSAVALWTGATSGGSFVDALSVLASGGFVAMPAFALAVRGADGLTHVAVRGDVQVEIETAPGDAALTMSGVGASTWFEQVLADVHTLHVSVPAAAAGPTLPLVAGVVRGADVRVQAGDAGSWATAAGEPAAAANGPSWDEATRTTVAQGEGTAGTDATSDEALAQAVQAAGDQPVAEPVDPPPADSPADEAVDGRQSTEGTQALVAESEPTPEPAAAVGSPPGEQPEPAAATEVVEQVAVAAQPAPSDDADEAGVEAVAQDAAQESPVEAAAPAAFPVPELESDDEPAPAQALAGSPHAARTGAEVEDTQAWELAREPVGAGARVGAGGVDAQFTIMHGSLAELREGSTSWQPDLPQTPDTPAAVAHVVLSTGLVVALDRPVLLGRAPQASRATGRDLPRLVAVPSPQQDISRTHAEVRMSGDEVLVTDLDSTNGVHVLRPGRGARRLRPGEPRVLADDETVDLGDGVTFIVERGS